MITTMENASLYNKLQILQLDKVDLDFRIYRVMSEVIRVSLSEEAILAKFFNPPIPKLLS